jgi:N-acetylneuraminate synthase
MTKVRLGKRTVGDGAPLYFIADIAANHDGDLKRALKLIELAKEAGADAAKFQNFQASKIVSRKGFESLSGQLSHQKNWKKPVFETYQDASIPFEWTAQLKKKCDEVGIEYFTSPYDKESIDQVDPYVQVYKVGAGDITWLEILEYMAKKGKPVILSTGASTLEDVKRAMARLLANTKELVLMQCNTNYTASLENFKYINLNVLRTYQKLYPEVVLGLSDHTRGPATVLGAIALGARVFEKHFTDDNGREGPDHKFATNPKEWKEMVQLSNQVYQALGDGIKKVEENEKDTVVVQRRSVRYLRNLAKGQVIGSADLFPLRPIPQGGIPPYEMNKIIGKKLKKDVGQDDLVKWEDLN